MPAIGIAVTVLIVVLVILLIKRNHKTGSTDEALELLKLKYVKGEITEEEFQQKKSVLTQK
jgi:putative membrane protein